MKKVLFLCTNNSARSQIAESILLHKKPEEFEVRSAGTAPTVLDPLTVMVLEEIGLSSEGKYSKSIDEYFRQKWDFVITVCDRAREKCPIFPLATWLHWSIEKPTDLESFRAVRNELSRRIDRFIAGERHTDATGSAILSRADKR